MTEVMVLGLPLDEALHRLEASGITPEIEYTAAPPRRNGAPRESGSPRVVRYTKGVLTVARFIDHVREERDDHP